MVKMGSPSGNREDGVFSMPAAPSQPVQRTENDAGTAVNFGPQPTGNRNQRNASPDVPTGGSEATGTDLQDPGATAPSFSANPADIFRGATNTGTGQV